MTSTRPCASLANPRLVTPPVAPAFLFDHPVAFVLAAALPSAPARWRSVRKTRLLGAGLAKDLAAPATSSSGGSGSIVGRAGAAAWSPHVGDVDLASLLRPTSRIRGGGGRYGGGRDRGVTAVDAGQVLVFRGTPPAALWLNGMLMWTGMSVSALARQAAAARTQLRFWRHRQ